MGQAASTHTTPRCAIKAHNYARAHTPLLSSIPVLATSQCQPTGLIWAGESVHKWGCSTCREQSQGYGGEGGYHTAARDENM